MKVYRILTCEDWEQVQETLPLSPIDIRDGYIHLSTKEHILETANRYFSKEQELIVVAFDGESFGSHLKMEYVPTRKAKFPHLYNISLVKSCVIEQLLLKMKDNVFMWS